MVFSAVLAHFILNEKLQKLGVLGCVMCIAGSIIIVIHAPQEHPITSVQEIWSLATQPGLSLPLYVSISFCIHITLFCWLTIMPSVTAFLLYVASVIVLVFILIFHFSPRCGHSNVLVFTGICSLMGSLSVNHLNY